jgi:predicted N-acetyltransferase YhbS
LENNFQEEKTMINKDYTIRLEKPRDYAETENLTREAFWNVYRPGCLEHYVLHVLRSDKDFVSELDFVLEKDQKLIGHIMYMRASIKTEDGKTIPIMTFGPISISPEYKRQGYGKILLDYSMQKASELGCDALCIEGNIEFYGKSGFVLAGTKGIYYYAAPTGEIVPYFLVKELKNGYLDGITGVYHTPEGYFVDEKKAALFDAKFPYKEKEKLPGQLV